MQIKNSGDELVIRTFLAFVEKLVQDTAPIIFGFSALALSGFAILRMEYPLIYKVVVALVFLVIGLIGFLFFILGVRKNGLLKATGWIILISVLFLFFSGFTYFQSPQETIVIIDGEGNLNFPENNELFFNLRIRPFLSEVFAVCPLEKHFQIEREQATAEVELVLRLKEKEKFELKDPNYFFEEIERSIVKSELTQWRAILKRDAFELISDRGYKIERFRVVDLNWGRQ